MKPQRRARTGARRLEALDALMDSYFNWRDEASVVAEAYRTWSIAARGERGVAFDRYAAALDREERAASSYRRAVECIQTDSEPRAAVGQAAGRGRVAARRRDLRAS